MEIDIVLPCYAPTENWYLGLVEFNSEASKFWNLKYIIVNDGTTGSVVQNGVNFLTNQNLSIQCISYSQNAGKGKALRTGVSASKSDYVVYTDIDFPFTNSSMINLIKLLLKNEFDVIAGFRDEVYYKQKMTYFRKILSMTFRFFISRILNMKVEDTQCGLKGFNRKGKEIFLTTTVNRYLFDFEFIYLASRNPKISLGTAAVQLKSNVVFSKMKFKILLQEMSNLISVLIINTLFKKNKAR